MKRSIAPKRWIRAALLAGLQIAILMGGASARAQTDDMLIDDFRSGDLLSPLGTRWRAVTDQVMGGVSEATLKVETHDDRFCLRLTGDVRLENNGGFVQAALDLAPGGAALDASAYSGVRLVVKGNGEDYGLHLRTPDNQRPWQSYRAGFTAEAALRTVDLPFAAFAPYRLETPLDVTRLRRIGLVAIGRAFQADLLVCEVSFYR